MGEAREYDGRVIKCFGRRFVVFTREGTFDCDLRGRFRLGMGKTVTPVAVGDRVTITVEAPPYGVIETLHPRTNKLSRPDILHPDREQVIVANCDQLIVVSSVAHPRLKTGAIDRFLLTAEKNGLRGVVVINKADLATGDTHQHVAFIYESVGYPVVLTSVKTREGLDTLREIVRFKTSIFAGHSGVGKSSLLNALQPGLAIAVGEVSESTDRGIHTTTTVALHPLDFGGYIVDTPGQRVIGLWDVAPDELPGLFREFVPLRDHCRFRRCMHIGEPDCAVKLAVTEGRITTERYDSYLRIRQSLNEERPRL